MRLLPLALVLLAGTRSGWAGWSAENSQNTSPPIAPILRGVACGTQLVGRYMPDAKSCRDVIVRERSLEAAPYFSFGGDFGTCVACTEAQFQIAAKHHELRGLDESDFHVYAIGERPAVPNAPPPPPAPVSPPPVSQEPVPVAEYLGCFKDSARERDMPFGVERSDATVASCLAACGPAGGGTRYFGLQAGECYCGDAYGTNPRVHVRLRDDECGEACLGLDADELHPLMPRGAARPDLSGPRPCGARGHNAVYQIAVFAAPSSPPPPQKPGACVDNDVLFTKLSHGYACFQSTTHCLEGTMGYSIVRKLCPLACTVALRRGCKDEKGQLFPPVPFTGLGCEMVAAAVEAGERIPGYDEKLPPEPAEHSPASAAAPSPSPSAHDAHDRERGASTRPQRRHGRASPPSPLPPPLSPPPPPRRSHHEARREREAALSRRQEQQALQERQEQLRQMAKRHVKWEGCFSESSRHDLRVHMGSGYGTFNCSSACGSFAFFALQGSDCYCDDKFGNGRDHRNLTRARCTAGCVEGDESCCGSICEGEETLSPPRCCGVANKQNAIYMQLDRVVSLESERASRPSASGAPMRFGGGAILAACLIALAAVWRLRLRASTRMGSPRRSQPRSRPQSPRGVRQDAANPRQTMVLI